MKEEIRLRFILILITMLGVFSIGLGVSFFSNSLTISQSINELNRKENFNVVFSSSSIHNNMVDIGDVIPEENVQGISANPGKLNNTINPTIKDLSVTFNEPGEAVSYSFYASNIGESNAYLKNIIFSSINKMDEFICTPKENTTKELVEEACKDISITLEVGPSGIQEGTTTNIKNHPLPPKTSEKINIIVTYKMNGTRTDGKFRVDFGDISLYYSPLD